MAPEIAQIKCTEFDYTVRDVAPPETEYGEIQMYIYAPGNTIQRTALHLEVVGSDGTIGEYITSAADTAKIEIAKFASAMLGKNPLHREKHLTAIKHHYGPKSLTGRSVFDIALWDYAGHHYGAPIHELIGTCRERFLAYASSSYGQNKGGLDSPEAYADFAEECVAMGYPAFKIHGFVESDDEPLHRRDIAMLEEIGERVNDDVDLMLDGHGKYDTWAAALQVGKTLDAYDFYWYEDPYISSGPSGRGTKELRHRLDTPILQTDMYRGRGLESRVNQFENEGADFIRADPEYDGGITGAIKLARYAESLGIDIEYHTSGPVRRHCIAATRNSNYYEMSLLHPNVDHLGNHHKPYYRGEFTDARDAIGSDGTVAVPDNPGIGVEIDRDLIAENTLSVTEYT